MEISYYEQFATKELLDHLITSGTPVSGVPDLVEVGKGGGLESKESLRFLCELYELVRPKLEKVLTQREADRLFFDRRTYASHVLNKTLGVDFLDPLYVTVIGQEDSNGNAVVGPVSNGFAKSGGNPVAPVPPFLRGPHVTLFGPPDDAKLSINAMNAYHRKIKGEPPIVDELLRTQKASPMWGADDEDSKTPLREDLVSAGENLTGCFEKTLQFEKYQLQSDHLSLPIKRFPGLALPGLFLFYKGSTIPLHLYDFALHFFKHYRRSEALAFYVPKLETPEEARYIRFVMEQAEDLIQKRDPGYNKGSIRLFIVLENPRAIFRTHEIMEALYPYFAGASLGWHDFLSSTARLFREDSNYRIPVKADPNIVINYIKASHDLLANVVGSRGGIAIGGMYGVLPLDGDLKSPSFQITLKGFIKDVVTQLKRRLTGFWVAHPDFVRIGLALVEAWRLYKAGDKAKLETLATSLLNPEHHQEILAFIHGPDITGLEVASPLFPRSLIVADLKESTYIANHHPDEIRYNVFQSLQYLADWLAGNGCVALPSQIDGVPVRVMDDLATAERSRWEVWHEIHHGRFSMEDFIQIAHEEMTFIRKGLSDSKKIVQVKWTEKTGKWYPVALRIMIQLMTSKRPVEFASELLLPFTVENIRNSNDPLQAIFAISPDKYSLEKYVEKYHEYFSMCGSQRFAKNMAQGLVADLLVAESVIRSFDLGEVNHAAGFHGDIGEAKKSLDTVAAGEQALVHERSKEVGELRELGEKYRTKFGFKFLISAKGKTGEELFNSLERRLRNTQSQELENAKVALWEITKKRLLEHRYFKGYEALKGLFSKHGIASAQLSISSGASQIQSLAFGNTNETLFEIASISKTIAATFSLEFFKEKKIPLSSSVNELLKKAQSDYRIPNGDTVTIQHLLEHTALNLHYINGYPTKEKVPPVRDLLDAIQVIHSPGTRFSYSGGGFLLLEHLLEALENESVVELTAPFLTKLGLSNLTFHPYDLPGKIYAAKENRLHFPAFAAGALGTATDVLQFLRLLSKAFRSPLAEAPISHETAVRMLHGTDKGSREFMGADVGLGIFTLEAGPNRLMVHQGANEGFRGLFAYCYEGPDVDKGFSILCEAENQGVFFIAETAQRLLKELGFRGINFNKFKTNFDISKLPQEQIVNLGYKELLFNAFVPELPEAITDPGSLDPFSGSNLAVGSTISDVTNQQFARAENLISPFLPKFDPELYGRQGKIMDSWETIRHNTKDCDSLVLKLKQASEIRYATFSTQFHLGNHAPVVRLEGKVNGGEWQELVPKTALDGHSFKGVPTLGNNDLFEAVRVSIYPDGGLTRLGIFKEKPSSIQEVWEKIPHPQKPLAPKYIATPEKVRMNWERVKSGAEIDVASSAYGGTVISASNEHYGPATQVISPYPPLDMFDGFESARSRESGHSENLVIALGRVAVLNRIELDFTYFRHNNPREVSVEALVGNKWSTILEITNVKAFAGNTFVFKPAPANPVARIRVNVIPDGGINRVRVFSKFPSLAQNADSA